MGKEAAERILEGMGAFWVPRALTHAAQPDERTFRDGIKHMETAVAAAIRSRLSQKATSQYSLAIGGERLNDGQRAAVRSALTHQFSLISGPAGSGKSTVIRSIAHRLHADGHELILLAPTGRAAARLKESTGFPATTIAAFLCRQRPIPTSIPQALAAIIDESSMIDLPTLYSLLLALPSTSKVVLVGDIAQLAPIGIGKPFHEMARNRQAPNVELTEIIRAGGTSIPIVANLLRRGEMPDFAPYSGVKPGVSLIDTTDIAATVESTWQDMKREAVVLAPVKAGKAGVIALNQRLHQAAHGDRLSNSRGFKSGDPVVFRRNDYRLDLQNGSLGTWISPGRAEFDERVVALDADALESIELAYAMTVHRAQGSEFDRVIIALPKGKLLSHALIYTAITRATKQAVLVGEAPLIRAAITP